MPGFRQLLPAMTRKMMPFADGFHARGLALAARFGIAAACVKPAYGITDSERRTVEVTSYFIRRFLLMIPTFLGEMLLA